MFLPRSIRQKDSELNKLFKHYKTIIPVFSLNAWKHMGKPELPVFMTVDQYKGLAEHADSKPVHELVFEITLEYLIDIELMVAKDDTHELIAMSPHFCQEFDKELARTPH